MPWRRRLRKASFRGVRFNLVDTETNFGRRTANHEFPLRDEPYSEDLGRKAREFSFDAYINGFEYFRQRDKLIAACEKKGPGKLVHPYFGNKDVVCTECQVRETSTEGGMARFRLTFREAGSLKFPSSGKKAGGLLSLLGLGMAEQAINDFTSNIDDAVGSVQYVVDSLQEGVTQLSDALEESTDFITRNTDAVANLAFSIQDLRDDLDGLISIPSTLANRIAFSFSLLKDSIFDSRESLDAYRNMFAYASSQQKSSRTTPSQLKISKHIDATNNFGRRLAIANAVQVVPLATYESVEDAEEERKALFDAIDDQLNFATTPDDLYQTMQQIKAELKRALPPEDQKIPDIITVRPVATTNSIVLSYELYGNLENESDIVNRNKISHPGFIIGGEQVKVLSNG